MPLNSGFSDLLVTRNVRYASGTLMVSFLQTHFRLSKISGINFRAIVLKIGWDKERF